jgi:hypothetical protein
MQQSQVFRENIKDVRDPYTFVQDTTYQGEVITGIDAI